MGAARDDRPYRDLTTLKTVVGAGMVFLLGLACLYLGGLGFKFWSTHQGIQALVDNMGAVLVISVGLAMLWELVGKRAFAREVLENARVTIDVEKSGIRKIGVDYISEPEWDELFDGVHELDIFVAYGRTWHNLQLNRLKVLAKRKGARIRVFIADPEDEQTVTVLSYRFSMAPEELRRRIEQTRVDYESLRERGGASIEVFYYPGDRLFAFYRFDETAIITIYQHRPERAELIPTLTFRSGGSFYDFIVSELKSIDERSRTA